MTAYLHPALLVFAGKAPTHKMTGSPEIKDQNNRSTGLSLDVKPEKILVVSLDNLGDLIFYSSLIPALHSKFPQAKISLWCKSYAEGVARLIPGLDTIHAADPFWDRSPGRPRGGKIKFLQTLLSIRREHFDLALVPSPYWKVSASVALSRIPVRIGFAQKLNGWFLTHMVAPVDIHAPIVQETARLLGPLGLFPDNFRYQLDAGALAPQREHLSTKLDWERMVVIHPFAGVERRCARLEIFLHLAEYLPTLDFDVLWLGKTEELDRIRAATNRWESRHFIDTLGDGTQAEMDAAISLASLYVGHNSGPIHVAGGLGIPNVGIYTVDHIHRTFPQGMAPFETICRESPKDITMDDLKSAFHNLIQQVENK